jgi:hypothetical protein
MFQSVLVSSRLGARRDRLVAHRGERFEPRSRPFQENLPAAAHVEVRSSEEKMPTRRGRLIVAVCLTLIAFLCGLAADRFANVQAPVFGIDAGDAEGHQFSSFPDEE